MHAFDDDGAQPERWCIGPGVVPRALEGDEPDARSCAYGGASVSTSDVLCAPLPANLALTGN